VLGRGQSGGLENCGSLSRTVVHKDAVRGTTALGCAFLLQVCMCIGEPCHLAGCCVESNASICDHPAAFHIPTPTT